MTKKEMFDLLQKMQEEVNVMERMYGLNETHYINENEIVKYETSNGDIYEDAYQLDDGRWCAFDNGVNSWVMLG